MIFFEKKKILFILKILFEEKVKISKTTIKYLIIILYK